ncbi:MAG: metalloregulator ArsR/SmtB family transcription factor [Clostridiales Family XIII bacterium]|jgi:ArsR family transcriptional regulator|nr:metalloregulator ArsR/SmtB family transcription factor [Clostridiales Family XIII bacterium]
MGFQTEESGGELKKTVSGDVRAGGASEGDGCECHVVHVDVIKKVRAAMPADADMCRLAELFKSFGDQTRLNILFALSKETMCVCDIAALVNMSQSAVSHQLRVLRNVRLVKYEKKGKSVYYSLDDEHVKRIFKQGLVHVEHTR